MSESKYDHLEALSDGEIVAKRPEMFIGSTEDPTHLWTEVFDNALDECIEGHADEISIIIDDEHFTISDTGRGMPQGIHEKTKLPYPILAATKLFTGGKYDNKNYKVKAGLHGVGLTCVNYLSDRFIIYTTRDSQEFYVEFDHGKPGKPSISKSESSVNGTCITAFPTAKIFGTTQINEEIVKSRCKLAVTFLEVDITINGKKVEPYSDQELCPGLDTPVLSVTIELKNGEGAIAYLAYDTKGIKTELNQGSVNLLRVNDGAHIRAFENAVISAWRTVLDKDVTEYLGIRDYLIGAKGFVLFFLLDPKYKGQTKEILAGKASQYDHIADQLSVKLAEKLKEKSFAPYRNALIAKFKDYRKHINELNTTTFLNDILQFGEENSEKIGRSLKLDSKLFDSSSPKRDGTELFICEGDSAGGGLVSERNSKIHAILPLRGKSLNVIDRELGKILQNLEIRSLVNAIGCGVRHKEDPSRIRYGKIIICSDADIDGAQIQALLLGALCYLVPQTVAKGLIYVAKCPLFGQMDGKKWTPIFDQKDLNSKLSSHRYKGLGSMEPWQLAKVLFDENVRQLTQVTLKNGKEVEQLVGYGIFKKQLLMERGVIK
jgi:DNA gyrase subunit B